MYQRARKLAAVIVDPVSFANHVVEQLDAYLVAINALSLSDQEEPFIACPTVDHVSLNMCAVAYLSDQCRPVASQKATNIEVHPRGAVQDGQVGYQLRRGCHPLDRPRV